MNQKENGELKSIAKHVCVLNKEVGLLQKDITKLKTNMKWIVRIIGYMAALLTVMASKVLFF